MDNTFEVTSFEINVISGHDIVIPWTSAFRSIQALDKKTAEAVMKDLEQLVKKWEGRGCHVVR
jgi:hypothetical protein